MGFFNSNISPAVFSAVCHLGPSRHGVSEVDSERDGEGSSGGAGARAGAGGASQHRYRESATSSHGNGKITKEPSCITSAPQSGRRATRGGGGGGTNTLQNKTNHMIPASRAGGWQQDVVDLASKRAYGRGAEITVSMQQVGAPSSHSTFANSTVLTQPPMC